jgi:hypothetical protein
MFDFSPLYYARGGLKPGSAWSTLAAAVVSMEPTT